MCLKWCKGTPEPQCPAHPSELPILLSNQFKCPVNAHPVLTPSFLIQKCITLFVGSCSLLFPLNPKTRRSYQISILKVQESIQMCVCLGGGVEFPTSKQFSNTSWVSYNSAQFWHSLPGDSIRSHRLRAQSYKTHTPIPLLTPIASPGHHLCFWSTAYKSEVPTPTP